MQVVVPGNGGIALASVDDLGIANAKLLVSDEYINQTVSLPGPKVRMISIFPLRNETSLFGSYF
jgi:hypothetical protein